VISPDLAFAQLMNRTAVAYTSAAPTYITYRERTHISAPSLGRSQEINRFVQVRQSDDYAVMQDLPQGAQRTGQAFPIIPYFDPFTSFSFSWFANLKNITITLKRGPAGLWPLPQPDPTANAVVPYFSFWMPSYAADSTEQRMHLRITPTASYGSGFYPYEVVEDPQSHLPAHVEMRTTDGDESISFDYKVLQGHWMITRGTFSSTQHFGPMRFQVIAQTDYQEIAFPSTPPDQRLAPS